MISELIKVKDQFAESIKIVESFKPIKVNPNRIIICGMGGSSLHGYFLRNLLKDEIVLEINSDYSLPTNIDKNTLIFIISISGNTQETLDCLTQAIKAKATIICMSSGGKLEELATKNKLPFIAIPKVAQPRYAIGYLLGITLEVFKKLKIVNKFKHDLEKTSKFLDKEIPDIEKIAKKMAVELKGYLPVIYSSVTYLGLARYWKVNFNENSKVQSFWNVFPELNHNEMVGYTALVFTPMIIYLRSNFDDKRIGKRMDTMKKLLEKKVSFMEVTLKGNDILEEISYGLMLSLLTSYNLALELKQDPIKVDIVEKFKGLI